MVKEFRDEDLGIVKIIYNTRAKRVIARRKMDYIQLTVPDFYNEKQIYGAFLELKPRISTLKARESYLFTPKSVFRTVSFDLQIIEHDSNNFYVTYKGSKLSIACPRHTKFEQEEVQTFIRNNIEIVLRKEAKKIILPKIDFFAKQKGFSYTNIKINKSRSRWGSCSSKKGINISYFSLLLPEYLVDFIILHELCHTVEMNHGERFWQLLNSVTDNRARNLTAELNATKILW